MRTEERESNIELLKIIAVFIIVLCHTGISMTYSASGFSEAEWFYDVNSLPNSVEKIALTFFNYCGYIGNSIFFVCSAWFLLEKKQNRKIKLLKLELDVWIISVLYLAVFVLSRTAQLRGSTVIRSLFPTTFNNNWFVTAYMLFYFIYPGLNRIIENASRNQLKYSCLFFMLLICIWVPFFQNWTDFKFYFSYPLMWVLIYFCIAYLKKYHLETISSLKFSIPVLCLGIIGIIGEICATYCLGEYTFLVRGDGMRWNMWWNPFHWMIALGSFSLFRNFRFHSRFVNRISSLSLLIYLIHENYMVRDHWRPYLYVLIHDRFHQEHVALWLLLFAVLTFVVSAGLAFLYQCTIQRTAYAAADRSCQAVQQAWLQKHSEE